jgi:hypothetical protein
MRQGQLPTGEQVEDDNAVVTANLGYRDVIWAH